ncbi:hypothetical protein FRC01_003331 [Tulasnella sp. 417]|nr:hypothetical protein FRC01_003331 [Tulasnella sp. 417]
MVPSSISQPIIFDGTDENLSFDDFVRQLQQSSDQIDLTSLSVPNDIHDIVIGRLYGDALRYYETLDPDCQNDWSLSRNAMARRFPGGLPKEKRDKGSLQTRAQAPPTTSATWKAHGVAMKDGSLGSIEDAERSYVFLSTLKERLRGFLSTPSPILTDNPEDPQITVHSMIIQDTHGGAIRNPQSYATLVEVKLSDPQSVAACETGPLITIPSNNAARYRVAFTFTIHHGDRIIWFRHEVLAPKKSKIRLLAGRYTVSPKGQSSAGYPFTKFIAQHQGIPRETPLPGRYTIKSSIMPRVRDPRIDEVGLGAIVWILHVSEPE